MVNYLRFEEQREGTFSHPLQYTLRIGHDGTLAITALSTFSQILSGKFCIKADLLKSVELEFFYYNLCPKQTVSLTLILKFKFH